MQEITKTFVSFPDPFDPLNGHLIPSESFTVTFRIKCSFSDQKGAIQACYAGKGNSILLGFYTHQQFLIQLLYKTLSSVS